MTNPHAAGDQPSRSTTTLTLGLGLVQIPCSLYSALDPATPVRRSTFTTDGHPVGNMAYDKETGQPYTGEKVMMAPASDGSLVPLEKDELEQFMTGTKGAADIEGFIPLSTLVDGTYVVDGLCQMRPAPKRIGSGPKAKKVEDVSANKAFALLCAVMAELEVAALVQVVRRDSARYAALMPNGRLAILAFADQVRADRDMPVNVASEAEAAMVRHLIQSVGIGTPVLADTAGVAVQEYIDAKAALGTAPVLRVVEAEPEAPVDLLAALMASVEAAKVKAAA